MDPQKQGEYPPQNYPPQSPQQFPPAPQQPQQQPTGQPVTVAGQGYVLPQPAPTGPVKGTGGKSRKKLWVIVGFVIALLLGGLLAYALFAGKGNKSPSLNTNITKTYDSPAGLLPSFQSKDIQAGKFKLSANYVTGGDFSREGSFFVADGKADFEMLHDAPKVNELIKALYLKADPKFVYNDIDYGASRNFKYDFNSLLGFQYLYDPNAGAAGGYIPMIEDAKVDPKKAEANKLIKLGDVCDTALDGVKSKTGSNLTTTGLRFDVKQSGVRTEATVSFSSRQDIDRAVIAFFDNCFDFSLPSGESYKAFVDQLKESTTKSPTFAYWQENGKDYMTISPAGDNLALKSDLKFEFTSLNSVSSEKSGETSSFVEKRNAFGLAYSLCRVHPVVATDIGFTYSFLQEDEKYKRPSEVDAGYYCTTLSVSPQYKAPANMTVTYVTGVKAVAAQSSIDAFRSQHDMAYQIEKFNMTNKRYPGPTEFTDLSNNNMAKLTGVTQGLLKGKSLVYAPAPKSCVGDCTSYSLTLSPQATLTIERKNYQ